MVAIWYKTTTSYVENFSGLKNQLVYHNLWYVYVYKVKLETIVKGNPKLPFSVATTPSYKGGCYSFPWISLPLIRTLWRWVLSKEVSSNIFWVFGMTWPGIESHSPWPLANSLPTRKLAGMCVCVYIYIYIYIYTFLSFSKSPTH